MKKKSKFFFACGVSIACSVAGSFIYTYISAGSVDLKVIDEFLGEGLHLHLGGVMLTTMGLGSLALVIPVIHQKFRLANLASQAGLCTRFSFSAKERSTPIHEIQKACKDSNHLTIFAATGKSIFVEKDSLLGDLLESVHQQVTIFLLNPCSSANAATLRAESIGEETPKAFRQKIVNSIGYLKDIRKSTTNFDVYLYDYPPTLGIFLNEDRAWLQYYERDTTISSSPILGFYRPDDKVKRGNSFYYMLSDYLDRQKYIAGNKSIHKSISKIDLDNWRYPSDLDAPERGQIEKCRRSGEKVTQLEFFSNNPDIQERRAYF